MDYTIETEFQGSGFVAVPNHVAQDQRLSPDALGVLVYLASLPKGYILRVGTVQERFGFGKDRWQRIARELRAVGAMRSQRISGAGGRWIGERVSVRWPEPVEQDQETGSRKNRKPEKPEAGKSANRSRIIRQSEPENPALYKDKEKDLVPAALSMSLKVGELSPFALSCLREGKPVPLGAGKQLPPDALEYALLRGQL